MLLRHLSDRASEVFYLEPTAEHTHTLIYLHHQTGRAWDFVDRWKWFDRMTGVRVVLPEAPKKYSAWYEGETTFWYDYVPNPDNNPKEVPLVDTMQECLRTPVNNIEYFPPNFEGLVLGCIDADFCK